jgi:hypothetical protein
MIGMNLHGAFFKGWRTDQVKCDYVYMDVAEEERVSLPEGLRNES